MAPVRLALYERRRSVSNRGITLIEMIVSIAILAILMVILAQIIQLTSSAYRTASQSTSSMQAARVAFERLTRNLSQATLNTYYSYYGGNPPAAYIRQSELQFISGIGPIGGSTFISSSIGNAAQITHAVFFQAPLGATSTSDALNYTTLNLLLNACGYFVMYGNDVFRPSFLDASHFPHSPPQQARYRLMEYLQPSEYLSIYSTANMPTSNGGMPGWISNGFPNLTVVGGQTAPNIFVRPLANNIVALIVMPEQFSSGSQVNGQSNAMPVSSSASPSYNYDSAYQAQMTSTNAQGQPVQTLTGDQLPPLVKVVMVAIDEASAIKLSNLYPAATASNPPPLGNVASSMTLFQNPNSLLTNSGVEGDLEKFEDILNATPGNLANNKLKLNYFVFQTDVIIRGSKWDN